MEADERHDSARTFMRSVVGEDSKVGLMLFDEPSASLDPIAEHSEFAVSWIHCSH